MHHAPATPDPATASPLKVFIAEDSPVMLPRLVALVIGEEGLVVCGTADAVVAVFPGICETGAEAVILDINLKDGNSLPALAAAVAAHPALFAIVCSNSASEAYREAARLAGAHYFIDKSLECDRIPALLSEFRVQAGKRRRLQ